MAPVYSTYTNVTKRVPYRSVDATSTPSSTDVNTWLERAEAKLHAALISGGIATPITSTHGVSVMKDWTEDYAEGRLRKAYASADGDGDNEDGEDLIEAFRELCKDIVNNPHIYDAMLNNAATEATRRVRGYVTDNTEDKTVSAGDFAPTFTKSRSGDQF